MSNAPTHHSSHTSVSPSIVFPATHELEATTSIAQQPPAAPAGLPTAHPSYETDATTVPTSAEKLKRASVEARVLHLVNGEHFSGAERVQSHLGRCLPSLGIEADFACLKPGRFAEKLEERDAQWGRCFRVPMKGRFDIRVAWKIQRLVRRNQIDLLHAHTPRSAMIASLVSRLTGTPWLYHVHSPVSRDSERLWINRLNALIERGSLLNCTHQIAVSNSLHNDCLAGGARAERVTVVHNGVPGIRPTRLTTPSPGGRWVIGMIALMRPRKGLEIAIDALARLRAAGHDVVLRCIGPFESDAYQSEIEAQIDANRMSAFVERVGFTDNVPQALAELDLMVLPSLYGEGLPMVVLEAMAAAVPVVATRVEGTPEAIRHEKEGLLAEPANADSLSNEIARFVRGEIDWNAIAENAFVRHRDHFSDQSMANATAAIYRKILRLDLV